MPHQSVIQALLGDVPASRFVCDYYLRSPFAGKQTVPSALAPIEVHSITSALLTSGDLDLLVGRGGQIEARLHKITAEELHDFLHRGQTLGFRHVQNNHAGLADWASRLGNELGGDVDVHLYWTPSQHPGFGWHYDAEEVFVLQLGGSKTWQFRKNTVNPWPLMDAIPSNQRYEREVMRVQSCHLSTGNWLYLPSGYWHRTEAVEESISLSVGIRAGAAIDILDFIRTQLNELIECRERLPCGGTVAGQPRKELEEIYSSIAQRLSAACQSVLTNPSLPTALINHFHRQTPAT